MTKHIYVSIFVCLVLALLGFIFIRNLIDFPVYFAAGQSLIKGRTDLYAPDFALGRVMDYRYLPFFLVAFTPLWLIPYSISAYIWYLLSVIEIAGCLVIISRIFPGLADSKKAWLLIALSTLQYLVMAVHYGNAHLLAVFLLFASLYSFQKGREGIAGLLMAVAITIKLTPFLLLPYFVLKRRWRMLSSVCVLLIIINFVPSVYFGISGNIKLIENWYEHVISSQDFHEDNGPINLSLKGELRRYVSPVDYSKRVDGDVQYPAINFASLTREDLLWAWIIGCAILFVAVLLLIWFERASPQAEIEGNNRINGRFALEMSLMLCLMLLVGPLTSKIYFVTLLWPIACLADIAVRSRSREAGIAMRVLILIAIVNSVLPLLPGRSIQRLLLVVGIDFYVNLLAMSALAFVLISSQRLIRSQSGEPQMRVQSAAKMP
ncbi:MAG TPA: glycosyltransferase family 87 protein [Blastocatellia bacterium]|nr:glycosyltransferase family 87 protein [Blastocatellia bacterium]